LPAIPPEWQVVADGVPSVPLRPTVILCKSEGHRGTPAH
jgi:hypothetical protein